MLNSNKHRKRVRKMTDITGMNRIDNPEIADAIEVNEIIEETTQEEQSFNFTPIDNFKADLTGAERLMWKGVKLINRYANIHLNQWDKEDAISAVYVAVVSYEPTGEETPLAEVAKAYFGIDTREQFRAGYNALQRVIYGNRSQAMKTEYNQEYGLNGVVARDETQEIELDLLVKAVLSEKLNRYLDYYLQGYSQKEIAEIMGVSQNIPTKYLKQCKAILGEALSYKAEDYEIK